MADIFKDPHTGQELTRRNGAVYNHRNQLVEKFEGRWRVVRNGDRSGWWRYNNHYDRDGYCDNPGRGY